jgi:hypothetical protein
MTDDLTCAVTEINEHAPAYREADRMYRGKVEEVFATNNRIVALLREASKHYRTNLAGVVVDAVLNALEITSVTIPNAQGETDQNLTQVFKDKVWDANQLDLYLPDWLREVGKEGDAYLVVWEGDEDGTCEVHTRKPVGARMIYDQENDRIKKFFAYMWKEDSPKRTRVNLMYPDRVEKYVSGTKDPKSSKDFQRYEDESDGGWPVLHGYDEVAAFHGRTDHPYGVPDHANAYGPQNLLNKVIATFMGSIDFTGFPQRAALQDSPIDDDGDDWDQDDNESSGGTGIGMDDDSKLRAEPGSLWLLKNTKSLVSLPAADVDNFLKPIDKAAQLISATTGTPIRFFNGTQGQQPSGASLREDDARLNARRAMRILLAGATLRDAFTFAMRKVLGYKDCPEVVINWKPVRRAELLDEWQAVESKQAAGVPRDTTLLEAGYTPTQIAEWAGSTPDPGEGLGARIELLERLASAASQLATAAELGALDMGLVQQLMAGFLPAPLDDKGNPIPLPPAADDEGPSLKQQAEMVQKIYLGVPSVLSRQEARQLLADAGLPIDPGAPPVQGE